jgi:signal transduction histidine kinase
MARAARRRWRPGRPRWPRSLAGQTLLVLMVGLMVSHLLALGLYSFDRLRLLEMLGARAVVARVVEVTRLIEGADADRIERRLLRALDDPRLRARILPAPPPDLRLGDDDGGDWRARLLRGALLAAFDEDPPRVIRVRRLDDATPPAWLAPPDRARFGAGAGTPRPQAPWRTPVAPEDERGGPMRHDLHRFFLGDPQDEPLAIAVALNDGRWLAVLARVPRPQGFWTPGALASLGLMGAVTLILSIWAVRRMTRPLRAVADAAHRTGADARGDPLPETGSTELREVTRAFNAMRARLARLVDNRTRLLAAISHDLRTPITTLRLRAEFVEDEAERARMLATLDDMEAMVRATLDFARDDGAAEPARPVDPASLVGALCDDLAETGLDVSWDEAAMAPVIVGRPSGLRRAVTNLVRNACVHGGGARVTLETAADGAGLAVVVCDDGPGIPDEDITRVTEPFFRVEGSRSRRTGGIGLGLSIVQAVADTHGGRLILRNRPEGGLEARLVLPTAPDQADNA